MRRALLAVLLLGAACSRRAALNYKHCLKVRVGMTKEEMFAVMGKPEKTVPYVEGVSLPYLKGRTAYEWSNPATMPEGDHISVDDATGKVQNVRCSDVDIVAEVYREPPGVSTSSSAAAASAPAAAVAVSTPAAPAAPAGGLPEAIAAYRKKDLETALKIANPIAGAENPQAQLLLGLIFFNAGEAGMNQNLAEAMRLFYEAGRGNDCEASALYAANSRGRSPDATFAAEVERAAKQGCPAAQTLQADLMFDGFQDIVLADPDGALKLLTGAAQAGSPRAQLDLGRRLRARKDSVGAYRWTLLASKHPLVGKFDDPLHAASNAWEPEDRAEAEKLLAELARAMTPAQLAAAKKAAAR